MPCRARCHHHRWEEMLMLTADMTGKTVMVTGANSGLGFVTARELACRNASVILACRREQAAREARDAILAICPDAKLHIVPLDLSSLASVRSAAATVLATWPALDVLVNNAGIAQVGRKESVDGIELTLATNHLGPFLLTRLLEPALSATSGRIINVASEAHRIGKLHFDDLQLSRRYHVLRAYAQSKLANILFTRELAAHLEAAGVGVYAVSPGSVNTNIWPGDRWYQRLFSALIRPFLLSPDQGAETLVWLATSPDLEGENGLYYQKCRRHRPSARARDRGAAQRLWQLSEEMTGLAESLH
ncbi:MAG: SDR family oxidoreductase [Halomonadaceae bacterium]|nr:MAG: SDR family oxidoreductase [Halomonadaceae bacterium]